MSVLKSANALIAVVLASFAIACNGKSVAPGITSPISPSPSPSNSPSTVGLNLSGIVTQVTPTGRIPVEGVLVEAMSCHTTSYGCSTYLIQSVTTDQSGAYKFSELYFGSNNFVWITKDGYEPVGMPRVPTCDYCNRILTIEGDTQLDIELARH